MLSVSPSVCQQSVSPLHINMDNCRSPSPKAGEPCFLHVYLPRWQVVQRTATSGSRDLLIIHPSITIHHEFAGGGHPRTGTTSSPTTSKIGNKPESFRSLEKNSLVGSTQYLSTTYSSTYVYTTHLGTYLYIQSVASNQLFPGSQAPGHTTSTYQDPAHGQVMVFPVPRSQTAGDQTTQDPTLYSVNPPAGFHIFSELLKLLSLSLRLSIFFFYLMVLYLSSQQGLVHVF